jgi:hypothetical protein
MVDPPGPEPSRAELHRRCRSRASTLLAHLTALADLVAKEIL